MGRRAKYLFLIFNCKFYHSKFDLHSQKEDSRKPFYILGVYSNENRLCRRVGMKKSAWRAAILFGFLCLVSYAVNSQDNIQGKWKAKRIDGKINLNMRIIQKREFGDWQFSRSFQESDFEGLKSEKNVNFRLIREAGTLSFKGDLSEEAGTGMFTFFPSREFGDFLERKGFDDVEGKDMLMLCLNKVTRKYIDDLFELGYSGISFSKLVSFSIHDIPIDFIKGVHALGYENITPSKIISFSIHDVTVDFIQELNSLGYADLDPSKLISFAIHDVTEDFVKGVQAVGYKDISPSELISFRIHDVDRKFIERMNKKWEKKLSPNKIISLKIQE